MMLKKFLTHINPKSDARLLPQRIQTSFAAAALSLMTALTLAANISLAQDPFRNNNPQIVGEKTLAAFKALFEKGDYATASKYLDAATSKEANEPLFYALKASLAYLQEDWGALDANARKTRETAQFLSSTNPLRGNLYTAASYFLEGASIISQQGTVKGTPQVLNKLREVFQYLDAAEKIAPQDPELNLLKGYMDLMLAVNLPFSDPTEAINRLEKYAQPRFLAERGIAVAYRNLKQYDKALNYVNRALEQTPDNPEVHYLKAQILVNLKKNAEAKEHFNQALIKSEQLPKNSIQQIFYEACKNQKRLEKAQWNCDLLRDKIRENPGIWGPKELPKLE